MAENGNTTKKTEVEQVQMTDGRMVPFPGKRRLQKETLVDESKIIVQGDTITFAPGAVRLRMDFRHGATRTIELPASLLAKFAGHGAEQKFGDNLAASAKEPLSDEDMEEATDELASRIAQGEWGVERESSGGFSGASIVVRALMERYGKTKEEIKTWLDGKLAAAKERGETLSRPAMYASFKASPQLRPIVERLQAEQDAKKAQKDSHINAEAELAELEGAGA